jgi:hypothetical protein
MENSDYHEHANHMVLKIVYCLFLCFMFAICAFMQEGK